jgi:phenylacetic acid degradation operon negative regulatory protein
MSISSESLPPDRAGSPSSLIVTFAGCYLRQVGGWVAVADLIRLLALLGVPEPAVRQSVLRLKSRGFLTAERRGGSAGYALTAAGRDDLALGDRRIFRYGQANASDGWVLAVFSVPEDHRHHRHQLRSKLGWLGFGSVGAGVWAAPATLAEPARRLLVQDGLDRYVTWFHARASDPVDVAAWWDLASLRQQYQAFVDRWEPVAGAGTAADLRATTEPVGDAGSETQPAGSEAFAGYLQVVDAWRLFPRIDPGLPADLLPADWPGPIAWQVFSRLRSRWADAGMQYLSAVIGHPAGPRDADRWVSIS